MLQNAYWIAKIGADTAENEQHFAEMLPIGRRVADRWTVVLEDTRERDPGSLGGPRVHEGLRAPGRAAEDVDSASHKE